MTDEILTGNDEMKSAGGWVFTDQGVADGFKNVSQYWLPKTLTFEQGFEQIALQKQGRTDVMTDVRGLTFANGDKGVEVDLGGQKLQPTYWAARQLCRWLNVPSTLWGFYHAGDAGDRQVIVDAFQNGMRKFETEKQLLFRTYNDGTLRAVMSDSYSIVDNSWYLECLQEFIPGGRLSHFNFGDSDNFLGNVLIPDNIRSEEDSDYGGMLNCGNSEIGKREVYQTPSIFRSICMNGCVHGERKGSELRQRHRGIDLVTFREAIRINIEKQIPLLTTKIPVLISSHGFPVTASIMQVFACISKQHGLNSEVTAAIGENWLKHSKEKSAFGVIDAITRAGQGFDAETWVQCDEIGGYILNGLSNFDVLNIRAKTFTEAEVQKAFGVSV